MDTTKFTMLEECIARLLGTLAQIRAENVRLSQRLSTCYNSYDEQAHNRTDWEEVQRELINLRAVIHKLRQERELIRIKLEAMLGTLERLEEHASAVEKP